MMSGKSFYAMVVANPKLRANGRDAEDAIENLKHVIRSHIFGKFVKIVDVSFDDLIVQEVMES